ncbi:MAG: hypothetical protein H8M99_00050 [Gloeobacteraceae cyanobacterium ES-bin-144]|nr:hypothetical protein [Verrucomicrobiales bacterium]
MRVIIPSFALLFAAAGLAEEIPRAIKVAEPPTPSTPAEADRVFSDSKQFRISGGGSLERGNSALLSEEAKKELMTLTGERDEWKIPISIRLHGKKGDPLPTRTVSLSLLVIEGVSELKFDYHLSRGIEPERFKRAITTALLYERNLRDSAKGNPERELNVPPWLADGLREANAWRLNQSDRRLYEALFKQGGLFKNDQLFAVTDAGYEEMDAATRAAFRVSSGALAMALLEQPQGKEGFRSFLTELAAYEGEMPVLLRKHFPELNLSETSLAKWWALQLASKGAVNLLTDVQSIQDTEAALAEALRLDFHTPEGIIQQKDLSAWPELAALKEPDRMAAVHLAQDALVRLSYRCFPSYRPLLFDYQQILDALAKNKTKDIAARLALVDESRVTMLAKAVRARDYLDWFEITRARETSGAFDDYLRLKERLKSNPHQRKDDWSKYLDQMDAIFYRKQNDKPAPPKP